MRGFFKSLNLILKLILLRSEGNSLGAIKLQQFLTYEKQLTSNFQRLLEKEISGFSVLSQMLSIVWARWLFLVSQMETTVLLTLHDKQLTGALMGDPTSSPCPERNWKKRVQSPALHFVQLWALLSADFISPLFSPEVKIRTNFLMVGTI